MRRQEDAAGFMALMGVGGVDWGVRDKLFLAL
jgi:hypothetical protein